MEAVQNFFGPTWPAVWTVAKIMAIVAPLMLCVAYLTLWERKVIGWMQVRRGPNRVTFFGIRFLGGWAQPIADGVKLLLKEVIVPTGANKILFLLAPVLAIMPALAAWAVVPFSPELVLSNIDAAPPVAWVSTATYAQLGLRPGDFLRVTQDGGEAVVPVAVDERLPDGCVRLDAARPETAQLGAMFGSVKAERVAQPQKVAV